MSDNKLGNIKMAVIMLDGCILDLNRYRFNYYKHLCEDNHLKITKEQFYDQLGNMDTMYNHLPLSNRISSRNLNHRIEYELLDYLHHKEVYAKEGLFELLDYFHQKDIKIAVLSTHSTKNAIEYLKLCRVYSHVNYIIGSDTKIKPLPSNEMLKAIAIQFDVKFDEMLVISPMLALNKAAYHLNCFVYYFEDLIKARDIERQTSDEVVSSFFDILNHFLFNRLYDAGMYSSILGMDNVKDKNELDDLNDHLKIVYKDDPDILDIIESTYQYTLSFIKEKDSDTKESNTNKFEETVPIIEETLDQQKLKTSEEEPKENQVKEGKALSLNEQETIELTSTFNKILDNEKKETQIEETKKEESSIVDTSLYMLSEFIYSFIFSFLVLFAGVIFAVVYYDYIGVFPIVYDIFLVYKALIDLLVGLISSPHISYLANELFWMFIFNGLLIFGIRAIYLIVYKKDLSDS